MGRSGWIQVKKDLELPRGSPNFAVKFTVSLATFRGAQNISY